MNLKKVIKSVRVESLLGGGLHIIPEYVDKPVEGATCPLGVLNRMALAKEIEELINKKLRRAER